MNTMSDSATRLQPSPTAGPLTAATIGTRHRTMPVTIWRPWTSVSAPQLGVLAQLVEVGEVAAGREGPPVAGQHDGPGLVVGVDLGEQLGQALVQLVVGGVEMRRAGSGGPSGSGPSISTSSSGGQVVGAHDAGSPRMRRATRLRWICDVPPMTLCARL